MKHLIQRKEFLNEASIIDPYDEERWDEEIEGYFICDRHRGFLYDEYVKDYVETYIRTGKHKIYKDLKNAVNVFKKCFFDDSDAGIYILYKSGEVERIPGYGCN